MLIVSARAWLVNHKGADMLNHQVSSESVFILHELDLGQHTLFMMSDGSIDLLLNDEQTSYLAENGMCLTSDETYRLFISLHVQFQQTGVQPFSSPLQIPIGEGQR
jgi:hypothetical protein